MRKRLLLGFMLGLLFTALAMWAQSPTDAGPNGTRLEKLEQVAADAKSSADNAWMLTSSALVLMMTGPGLALFYGGLVRKKNVLGTMVQSFAMMAVITILWALVSYSLAFGSGSSFIGGLHNLFLRGVGARPIADYAATIPLQTFMIYQLMFAIITPALITGRLCRAHEVQCDARLHGPLVADRLLPDGAHGVGQRRVAECCPGRKISLLSISPVELWFT